MERPRHILITGGSSGLGAALALAYAGPGIRLALAGRDAARLAATAARCRSQGAEVETAQIDVADAPAMADWMGRADNAQPLDLVLANAGVALPAGGLDERAERVRLTFAVNLMGVVNTVEPAIALMAPRQRGQIALMSSLAGFRGLPSAGAYSASKAAVKAYGEALRGELAAFGIAVSVICPGFVKSRMTEANKFPMPLLMESTRAAAIIKRGLARNQARIAFPLRLYAAMWLLAALPPALTDRLLVRLPKKE
ncbi:MAG TPA: SDR family NAD(P)-dependent oxidoreductase [Alphaproteobacteria bacterium]|nr:SDR family NAD(P)-dependent oxidoreductase [Alphaproteobacteria bacterium]